MQEDLYGIDPSARYLWTPRVGRIETKNEKGESVYGDALPGAPVVVLKPLPERLAMKAASAQSKYFRALAMAAERVRKGAEVDSTTDAAMAQVDDIYSQELQDELLKACIADLRISSPSGRKIEFRPDDWEWNFSALRASWRIELFRDIVGESAWDREDVEGFLSQPGSTAA